MTPPSQPTPWARAMVVVGFLASLGLAASSLPSYLGLELSTHLLIAVLSALVAVFSHSWILIYLARTGRAVRELAAQAGLGAELGLEAKRITRRAWPWGLGFLVLLVVAAYLGELAFNHSAPVGYHHGLGWLLCAGQVVAVIWERKLLARNHLAVSRLASKLPG